MKAIVMGATSGIGKEVALNLAAKGWEVAIAGRRSEKLQEGVAMANGGIVGYKQIDINDEDAPAKLRSLIAEIGGMDVYFHSSGIGWQNNMLDMEKELIISERSRSFAQEQLQVLQKMLEDIQIECEQNLHFIQTEDLDVLQKKMTASQEAIYSMRRDIRTAFEVCAAETKNYMVNVADAIKVQAEGHTDINVSEESRKIERSSTSGHLWWKKTTYRTDTEYYKAAEVKVVISNINKYIRESDAYLAKEINKAIEIDAVRNKIKGIVLRSFEKADANYDESDVIGPVEILLKSLMVPEFSTVDSKQYNKMIMDQFKESIVTGEKIADLRLKQEMILEAISKDFSEKIEKKTNEITRLLNNKAANFTDQVKKEIEGKINILNDGLQNKQESIQKYNEFLQYINNAKDELSGFSFD